MARVNIFKRKKAGLFAKRAGEWFENWLESECSRKGWVVVKIPSGCEWVGHKRAIPVRTPFDFIFVSGEFSIYGDAKTTLDKNFSYSQIKKHQLYWLNRIEKVGGVAGYVVSFRELDTAVFFSAGVLSGLKPRCSLAISDGIIIGNNRTLDLGLVRDHVQLQKEKINP